jgi:3-phenylpropionate/trans-cinnamate dioxygenase ferredoxin reductase subunit
MPEEIVVIGGGLAGARFALSYRDAGGEADVTIVSTDDQPPYNRPPLTKGFLRGELERDDTLVAPPEDYEEAVVDLRLATTVDAIDPDEHEVELVGGERIPYTTLVLATGARPRTLPIPGADKVGVHTYRTLADAATVRQAAEEAHAAIVIGGSFIGSESAASLRMRGLTVSLVEMGETLMPQLRAPEVSAELVELYRTEGVDVLLETQIEELTGNGKLLTGARLADGRTLEGYLAIVGVGVSPNVELAEAAGAEVDDGIVVDESFSTSLRDVYAIGDIASYPDPVAGRRRRIEHWSAANAQGTYLGRHLAGEKGERYDVVPVFFTQLFDRKLQVIGDVEQATECIVRGSLADGRLLGFHLDDDRHLVGALVHGHAADVAAELGDLLRERPVVDDPTRLLDENLRPVEAVAAS